MQSDKYSYVFDIIFLYMQSMIIHIGSLYHDPYITSSVNVFVLMSIQCRLCKRSYGWSLMDKHWDGHLAHFIDL